MRSNLGVGMPIDLVTVKRDAIAHDILHRIEAGEPYFHDLRERWSAALRAAYQGHPDPALQVISAPIPTVTEDRPAERRPIPCRGSGW